MSTRETDIVRIKIVDHPIWVAVVVLETGNSTYPYGIQLDDGNDDRIWADTAGPTVAFKTLAKAVKEALVLKSGLDHGR